MMANIPAHQADDRSAIYWQWVKWSALAALISAALHFLVTQILFPGAPPKSLIADLLITVTDILPFAVLQAHVLWRFFRVPPGAFIAWTLLPMLLIGGALLSRLVDEPSVPDTSPPEFDPFLTSVLGFAAVSIIVVAAAFLLAVILALLQWLAMNKTVQGLRTWLVWNGVGFALPTLGLLLLAAWYGFEQTFADLDAMETSPYYYIGWIVFMLIANLLIGLGVMRLVPRNLP